LIDERDKVKKGQTLSIECRSLVHRPIQSGDQT